MTESEGMTLEFNAKQAAIISMALGLLIGGLGGFAVGTATTTTVSAPQETQDSPGTANADMTPEESFRQISDDLGLDTETVMSCYENSNNKEAIEDRNNAVSNLGSFGTPTFFVGNREKGFIKISGAQPLSSFEQAFEIIRQDNPNSSEDVNMVSFEGIELEGEPSKGDKDAPIKVVEYNEFGCPFCAEWNGIDASSRIPIDQMDVADSMESQYIETGEVQLISKDYPVPQLHPNGPKAHKAANCVFENEQDSYWEFHDKLFERRDQWMQG